MGRTPTTWERAAGANVSRWMGHTADGNPWTLERSRKVVLEAQLAPDGAELRRRERRGSSRIQAQKKRTRPERGVPERRDRTPWKGNWVDWIIPMDTALERLFKVTTKAESSQCHGFIGWWGFLFCFVLRNYLNSSSSWESPLNSLKFHLFLSPTSSLCALPKGTEINLIPVYPSQFPSLSQEHVLQ